MLSILLEILFLNKICTKRESKLIGQDEGGIDVYGEWVLNGLDLFSGIGGLTIVLHNWVRPIAYCESDRYAQSVLLSRMSERRLPIAPIWDDVCTIRRAHLPMGLDIIYGGFPCQDISIAGHGKGLEGKRSGLFFEIIRLCRELRPRFVFLENVPAITVRGLDRILLEFTALGYDCRWTIVSAAEVGAPHLRERWFLLAHANGDRLRNKEQKWDIQTIVEYNGKKKSLADTKSKRCGEGRKFRYQQLEEWITGSSKEMVNPLRAGLEGQREKPIEFYKKLSNTSDSSWWEAEPAVGRVADGVHNRSHRLKGLGNAVVPLQAKKAFERLMGINL